MEIVRKRHELNRFIKETLFHRPDKETNFPIKVTFCEGIGSSTYEITIDKLEEDFFIDTNGCKWVKEKKGDKKGK